MKCKHEPCNNEAKGQGSYCSPTCKTLFNRNKKTAVTPTVTSKPMSKTVTPIVSLEHYQANPGMYIERTRPELLNWGKRMNMNELNIAGKKANRVPIPGDWDYEGVIK